MNEERFLILKMVEEGKITSEEAVALLDALEREPGVDKTAGFGESGEHGGSTPSVEDKAAKDKRSTLERLRDAIDQREDAEFEIVLEEEARRFAKNVEAAAEKFSRLIEERIEKEVKPALANLPTFLARIPVIREWVGDFSTVTEERQGTFLNDNIILELATDNGSIEVEGWPESHYHLVLKKKVRGKDAEAVPGPGSRKLRKAAAGSGSREEPGPMKQYISSCRCPKTGSMTWLSPLPMEELQLHPSRMPWAASLHPTVGSLLRI